MPPDSFLTQDKCSRATPSFFYFLIGLLFLVLLSGLTLWSIYHSDGWPQNHEYDGFFRRTLVYSQHFAQGDWFPIWSTTDNYDLGSPFPALYHKLFYLSAGLIFLASGVMKSSILLNLWLWLFIGGLGMYSLCRVMNFSTFTAWCGAYMLIVANYTVTDWLIRGAMGEMSAMMLVPWVMATYLAWLQPQGCSIKNYSLLGIFLGLTFLGHSVMAYYLILLLGVCTLVLIFSQRISIQKLNLHLSVVALITFVCIAGPYILAMHTLGKNYDMQRLLIYPFLPEYAIKPLALYFWDPSWFWGARWDSYTVQIDTPLLVLFFLGILAKCYQLYSSGHSNNLKNALKDKTSNSFLAILICILLVFFLQTKWAIGFYRLFPGANYLQFPWRLLGILTPLFIVLSLKVGSLDSNKLGRYLISGCLSAMLWICGAWAASQYPVMPVITTNLEDSIFGFNSVYVPSQVILNKLPLPFSLEDVAINDRHSLIRLHTQISEFLSQRGCTLIANQDRGQREALDKKYSLNCSMAGEISIPIFSSPLHWIHIKNMGSKEEQKIPCSENKSFPGMCGIVIEHPGNYELEVMAPTFNSWITGLFN